jgi:outer membrane receptor protein involved in Fe transport
MELFNLSPQGTFQLKNKSVKNYLSRMKNIFLSIVMLMPVLSVYGQDEPVVNPDTIQTHDIDNVTVTTRRAGTRRILGAENGVLLGREELFKAACCNLGESFTTNPSVDVNYSDAATGAKQIKLLGLSGTYVQLLTENLPNFSGSASPFALDYVPGPWMKSIQVSKGASSVRNGYESITGQIDIEYLKPEDEQGVTLNLFTNTRSRMEVNVDANLHLNQAVSTELLVHWQDENGHHDSNDDGFLDQPNVEQWNVQNRWFGRSEHYIFHGGIGAVREQRDGGQFAHSAGHDHPLYKIGIETDRYEGYMKHALILDHEHGSNIALMTNFAMQLMEANYGLRRYSVNEKNVYAQLLYETNFTERHKLAAGVSLKHDYLGQTLSGAGFSALDEQETVPGAYAQYTYSLGTKLTAMAGARIDHSSEYGTFFTPRLHVKWSPNSVASFRASAGKGYRTVHALAENNNLLASGRTLQIDALRQESAWNYGVSSSFYIPLGNKTLKLNAEYYYTRFDNQAVIDLDTDPKRIHVGNLDGDSYSNTVQVDATYPVVEGLELTAAWRWNDVKSTYGGKLMEKPLTSRFKSLFVASYKTPLGLWQMDVTLQLNSSGRLYTPYTQADGTSSWDERFPHYEQLSAQVTRWFRHWSIYVGGENLTGFRQRRTIIHASEPWSDTFDPTVVWGPVHGAMGYVGVRVNFGRM